ncbi:hypothetical protein SLEP1_g10984 [Rubroshorea leprosula]|uniref:Reverse transcriptase Ty1/copia-type domain-containing protein n=1 Tax=Rubroshorea leprosula TaxID=152421 RepID=A0AAV5IFM9_9ROSI|nr:hypothetical protein SLEP1_g10984 [Rubroshorea leprosula]
MTSFERIVTHPATATVAKEVIEQPNVNLESLKQDPRTGQLLGTGRKSLCKFHINKSSKSVLLLTFLLPICGTHDSDIPLSQPALSFSSSHSHSTAPFDLVHSDVWCPSPTPTMGAAYLINRIPSSVLNNQSPYERLHGILPAYNLLKACLVAKDFTQEYGINYEETFAPVARLTSVRSLLAIAAIRRWKLFQMDVKNAFLNGDLEEEVYMKPPLGLHHPPNKVCRLRRALYGLKQSPRAWYAKFSATASEFGFTSSPHDTALFIRKTTRGMVLLLLYVDDMIITGDDVASVEELKTDTMLEIEKKEKYLKKCLLLS